MRLTDLNHRLPLVQSPNGGHPPAPRGHVVQVDEHQHLPWRSLISDDVEKSSALGKVVLFSSIRQSACWGFGSDAEQGVGEGHRVEIFRDAVCSGEFC